MPIDHDPNDRSTAVKMDSSPKVCTLLIKLEEANIPQKGTFLR
jgi:hypothetical protein